MNIYVGNLGYEVQEDDLKKIVREFGFVSSIKIIIDRQTGRSKGFGFIEMDNEDEAKNAIKALDGKILQGRPMAVKEATPKTSY